MSLTSRDLERIREIVRQELQRAGVHPGTRPEVDEDQLESIRRRVREVQARMRAHAALPVPARSYLGTYDAAKLAGVSPATIVNWVKVGRLTKTKVKEKLSIKRDELEALKRGVDK